MNKKIMLSPSILDSDFSCIDRTIKMLASAKVDFIHLDVMDGSFVKNITFGPRIIKSIRPLTKLPFDAHLMIANPDKQLDNFMDVGADIITVHYEAAKNVKKIIKYIKSKGRKAGVSIKPKTPVKNILSLIPSLDIVLIMSVEPGLGGQKFMTESLEKVKVLRKLIDKESLSCLIEIDGGINKYTAPLACGEGADVLVAGNAIFGSPDPKKAISELRDSVKNCR